MDFFKSVFSDDPEPSSPEKLENAPPLSPNFQPQDPNPNDEAPDFPAISTAWSFGSTLLKTIATKSESVIETYRRDLEEFSSGLKLETSTIREAASRAVHELPARLESGAAVAQTSLESVGQAFDNIADVIVTRGKDSISMLASDDVSDSELYDNVDNDNERSDLYDKNENFNAKPYSRIEAAVRSVQCDLKTYCEEPEDLVDYNEWKKGVVLDVKSNEIEDLVEQNAIIREIYDEIVPGKVDHDTFWLRYFYRVYKVEKAEEARLRLVKRAIEGEDEELSWEIDDDEEEGKGSSGGFKTMDDLKKEIEESEKKVDTLQVADEDKGSERGRDEKESVSETKSECGIEEKGTVDEAESSGEKLGKSDEKASLDGKTDNSDFSVVSSQPSHEEEDLGWDEIEDIGSGDESKVVARTSPNRTDLRKRLSAAEEDEDLTWDIEDDDDEPAKS